MKTITNDFRDVELLNINPDATLEHRGPFLVVQEGIAPGDERQLVKMFALRPDGRWVDLMYYLSGNRPDSLDAVVFEGSGSVMKLLSNLGPKAQVEEASIDEAGLQAWLTRSANSNLQDTLRQWLRNYRSRQEGTGPQA